MRNTKSIILTHDNYGRLVEQIIKYLKENASRYHDTFECFEFQSWIDYLLRADVYILGFGMDFSEFDLWWLLSRKNRETIPSGEIIFFEQETEKNQGKHTMLKCLNVKVNNCGFDIKDESSFDYSQFYEAVIETISDD